MSNEKTDYTQSRPLVDKKVKAIDFTESLNEANTQRTNISLSPVSWGTTPVTDTQIKIAHANTLRTAVTGLVRYGSSNAPTWTDATITDTTKIRAIHMEQVRQVIDDRRNNARCNGCTSACYRGCAQACYSTCSSSCANDCSFLCVKSCSGTCGGGCSNCCTGCNKHCRGGYITTNCKSFPCQDNCTGTCVTGCNSQCYTGCKNGCYSSCATNCTTTCTGTCNTDCTTSCGDSCYNTCLSSCFSGCANSSRHFTDAGAL